VIAARAIALGIPLDEDMSVALFGPLPAIGSDGPSLSPGQFRERLSARLHADVWTGRSRHGFVALLPGIADPKHLAATSEDLLGGEGRVGVGTTGRDVEGLRRSAAQALRALGMGLVVGGADPVHPYAEVAVLDLVGAGSGAADDFARGVLGVLPDASPTHLETLRQLCAHNHSIKLAAAALGVHPHTLSYRLKQIRRRFGLDLDDAEVRLRVHLALLILDARGSARR
jgi:DNA-binding PucR family transcriptional regulator